jgi:sugar phosphate isomerase/epimerase
VIGLGSSATRLVQAGTPAESREGSRRPVDELPISTQLWTYDANSDKSVAELIRASAAVGYDAVEPFYLDDPDQIGTALAETDVSMRSAHVSVGHLEENFDELARTYSEFGASTLIHGYQSPTTFTDEDSIVAFAERVTEMADRLAEWGIDYGYHNYNHEFETTIGDETAYDIFVRHLGDDVHLQLDVGWALVGGADPTDVLRSHSGKIGSLHMKDMGAAGTFEEIGEGDVDMAALAGGLRDAADIDFLVYEYDGAPDPMESLGTGAEFLDTWRRSQDGSR